MKDKDNSDSKTLDVKRKTRFTDRMTVRMDPSVKKLLNQFSERTGISSCQIIHALLTGYLTAMGDKIKLDVQSPTINLTIERQVKRVRRYARERVPERVMDDGIYPVVRGRRIKLGEEVSDVDRMGEAYILDGVTYIEFGSRAECFYCGKPSYCLDGEKAGEKLYRLIWVCWEHHRKRVDSGRTLFSRGVPESVK